jgi:hypothetical protein
LKQHAIGFSDAVGVTYFIEVAYVFSNIGATAPQRHTQVAHLMWRYWASFIADSDPNGGKGTLVFSCFVYLLPPLPLLGHLAHHPQLVPTGQPIRSLSHN